MVRSFKMVMLAVTKIWESHIRDYIMILFKNEGHLQFGVIALAVFFLKVPLAFITPAEADGTLRYNNFLGVCINRDCFPFRVVFLTQIASEIRSTRLAVRYIMPILFGEFHQHRHIGVLATVIFEIFSLTIQMVFAQDHMAHGHGKRCISSSFWMQP